MSKIKWVGRNPNKDLIGGLAVDFGTYASVLREIEKLAEEEMRSEEAEQSSGWYKWIEGRSQPIDKLF